MVNIFGDRGKAGSRGARGPIGPVGKSGPLGPQGDTGNDGARGPSGHPGAKGDTGKDGARGPSGEKGERGTSGIEELCVWLPAFILQEFRKTESCSYFFPKDGSGFKKSAGVINKLISHSTNPTLLGQKVDAIAIQGCTSTIPIPNRDDRLALQFDGNMLYKAEGVKLSHPGHVWVCLCATFRVRAVYDQWIVNSPPAVGNRQFRAVTATQSTIRIWREDGGPPFVHVSYPKGSWVTVFVEWSNIGDRLGSVNINNGQSLTPFTCEELDATKVDDDVLIGAHLTGKSIVQGMVGDLAALEIYASTGQSKLPDYLKQLIIHDQMVAATDTDEPSIKRTKTMMEEKCVNPVKKMRLID